MHNLDWLFSLNFLTVCKCIVLTYAVVHERVVANGSQEVHVWVVFSHNDDWGEGSPLSAVVSQWHYEVADGHLQWNTPSMINYIIEWENR